MNGSKSNELGKSTNVNPLSCQLIPPTRYYLTFGFNKCGLKAQWSTQPRASEATPWVSCVGAVAPCKGKSFKPLFCYSYLIAELAVLKWNIVCISFNTCAMS